MRILILGAGATGGYFGGRLAEAGADVTFLVRPQRAEQLARDELVVESPEGDIRTPVRTVLAENLRAEYDAVLLSCKAYDLGSAIEAIHPAMGPQTVIVPLLNGLRHLEQLDMAFGAERVLGGLCVIAATMTSDGTIRHMNRMHGLTLGERNGSRTERVEALAKAFEPTKIRFTLSSNILHDIWEKWVMLATLAAMTCLMRASIGTIMNTDDGERLIRQMLAEICAVADAAGYAPRPDYLARITTTLTERGSTFTASMFRDIQRGSSTEADHIIGDLIRRAEASGVDVSLLRVAWCHLQTYEAQAI